MSAFYSSEEGQVDSLEVERVAWDVRAGAAAVTPLTCGDGVSLIVLRTLATLEKALSARSRHACSSPADTAPEHGYRAAQHRMAQNRRSLARVQPFMHACGERREANRGREQDVERSHAALEAIPRPVLAALPLAMPTVSVDCHGDRDHQQQVPWVNGDSGL